MTQDQIDWRSKYRQILGEKAELEEQFQLEVASLRRSLGKLGVATEGLVADIDADLGRLRQAIADDKPSIELQSLIESIASSMVRVDERRGQQGLERGRLLSALLAQLERLKLELPPKLKSSWRHTSKRLAAETQPDPSAFEQLVPQLMAIIEHQTGSVPAAESNGLFARLFSSKAESDPVASASPELPDLSAMGAAMRDLLTTLLQDDDHRLRLTELRQQIDSAESLEQLADLMQQLSALLVEINDQEQQQFESFLQQLTSRLDRIQGFFTEPDPVLDQAGQLEQQVRSEVAGLQQSVREATTLPQLQTAVQQRLDNILLNLDQFQQRQQQSRQQTEGRIARLKAQLLETEQESGKLRDQLIKQRLQAMTDSLTQLPNRFAYQVRLRHEYLRWHRHQAPLSLVIIDIDFFKKVNDTYGHLAGDKVLAAVGLLLTESIRETDFVARYGGEEFILLLPETSMPEATKLANKLRLKVQELKIPYLEQQLQVTLSAGISNFNDGDEPDQVLARADTALYRAKQIGRNQVCCEMPPVRRKP